MSKLGAPLERQIDQLVVSWSERLGREGLPSTAPELREEAARLLREFVANRGVAPDASDDDARARLNTLFQNAPTFMLALQGPSHVVTVANGPCHRLVGNGRVLVGLPIAEAVPEAESQGFLQLLDGVYRSGEPYVGREVLLRLDRGRGALDGAYLDFVYQPTRGAHGQVVGIDVFGFDVTEQVEARKRVEALVSDVRAQEEELRLVVDALPLLVSFVTAGERYGLVNKAYEEWFGIAREDLRGRTLLDIVGERAYAQLSPFVRRALAGERFTIEQYGVPYRLGGTRDVKVTFVPRRGSADTVEGYVALLEDITERRAMEAERERLLAAEREARREADAQRDLATTVAAVEANTRLASDKARARTEFLFNVAAALSESLDLEVVLQRLADIIAPAHAAFATVWSVTEGGPPRRRVHAPHSEAIVEQDADFSAGRQTLAMLPVERVIASGKRLQVDDMNAWMIAEGAPEVGRFITSLGVKSALILPIRRDDAVAAVLSLTRSGDMPFTPEDVAIFESVAGLAALAFENARLFGEMARLRRAAEEATIAKDRFLAHVSHDLRNPLNSILGWASVLRGIKNDPVQFMRGIDVIERNAKSQVQLIEDLLDVSRIASGKLALELAVEDVRTAVDTALDAARLAAGAKKVLLEVTVDDDIGSITVDPDRFRQIVWNLVSNAVKFTPSGGTVRVSAQRRASTFRLVVADTGRGIAPEFLPRVFRSFEQATEGAQRSGGLGLGLAIVRHLVDLHGGVVRVESDGEGQGSRFTVDLPIRAAVPPAVIPAAVARALEGTRVLVVDDEEEAREIVTVVLERFGAIVTGTGSADEALASLLRAPPDVIVSDIGMPGKDGKALLRDIRALSEPQGGRVPAIALTALVRAKDQAEILAAGFDAHVAKPVEPAGLAEVIQRLVRGAP